MSLITPNLSLTDLDDRARRIFKDIVDAYLETGVPVGSRTIALSDGNRLSPATIRNTMADLVRFGLLEAPHVSAGRIPSQMGLRLFVDGLLETGDLSTQERKSLEARLAAEGKAPKAILEQASAMLAGLAGGAGLVLSPARTASSISAAIRHVEFVSLDHNQALAVIVYEDGEVENRIMNRPSGLPLDSLEQAGHFLSAHLKGRRLDQARKEILEDIRAGRAALDRAAAKIIELGLGDWSGEQDTDTDRSLIIRGQAHLLENLEVQSDLEKIRLLFEELERKEDLIALLDQTEHADGVKIFIGSENPLFSLSESSVVIAPYRNAEKNIIGAVGVIGPTRLNYARIIPMVDYTAKLIGHMLGDTQIK